MTQRTVLSQPPHDMYTTGGLSTRVTESPPQAQQGFAGPTLELMYVQTLDSAEGLSRLTLHTAQRLSGRR